VTAANQNTIPRTALATATEDRDLDQHDVPSGRQILSRRSLEVAVALFALAFGGSIILGALEYHIGWTERGPEPGYFPFWMGMIVVVGAAGALLQALFSRRFAEAPAITSDQALRIGAFLLPMLGFLVVALLLKLGLYVGMVAYMLIVMLWQGRYRLPVTIAVSFGTAIFFYLIFERWLHVPLLKGPLEAWLGLH
jgi:hypothetical protein